MTTTLMIGATTMMMTMVTSTWYVVAVEVVSHAQKVGSSSSSI